MTRPTPSDIHPRGQRVEAVLTAQYPVIHRMAHALSGRADVGRAVVDRMLRTGLEKTFSRKESPPPRWFEHHTVLTTRRALRHQPSPAQDTLVTASPLKTPGYVAFIRSVRALPYQQREAFILHHAGAFEPRRLAVAMDCSTQAAANHLSAAETTLRDLSEMPYDSHIGAMAKAYANLLPDADIHLPPIRRTIRARLVRRRLFRLAIWLLILAIAAVCLYSLRALLPLLDT